MNGGRFVMKVVIHDMNREEFEKIYEKLKVEVIEKKIKKSRNWIENNEEEVKIISDENKIKNCTGCFCC